MPWTPEKVRYYLEQYRAWRQDIADTAYSHGRAFAEVSHVQAVRRSRPTEQAALRLSDLAERCATVEGWLQSMTRVERIAADYWLEGRTLPELAAMVGDVGRGTRSQLGNLALAVPLLVWARHYDTG